MGTPPHPPTRQLHELHPHLEQHTAVLHILLHHQRRPELAGHLPIQQRPQRLQVMQHRQPMAPLPPIRPQRLTQQRRAEAGRCQPRRGFGCGGALCQLDLQGGEDLGAAGALGGGGEGAAVRVKHRLQRRECPRRGGVGKQ
jgi:hypothetical protein